MTTTYESILRTDTHQAYLDEYNNLNSIERYIFDEAALFNKNMHDDARWEMPFAFKNKCLDASSTPWKSAIFNLNSISN